MAYHDGRVLSDDAWRKVKPFRETDAPVIRYISDDETIRLVNSCQGNFRDLVRGALLTGCRYGELCRMRVSDYNSEARVRIPMISPTYSDFISPTIPKWCRPGDARLSAA